MPYIAIEDRERARETPRTPGELNYAITVRIIHAWKQHASPLALSVASGGIRRLLYYYWNEKNHSGYTAINDIYGAMACSLLEFRRRVRAKNFGFEGVARIAIAKMLSKVVDEFYLDVAAPFEDNKKTENGDIY